jgi:quercetin dioxygenase-like cupin family protein
MLDPDMRAIHHAPGEGATVRNPLGGPLTFKARGVDTHGALVAFESTVAPGEGPPLHVHANEDEVFYVLEGTLRVKLESEVRAASAGSFLFIPRGLPHTWQNIGDTPARLFVMLTPAGLETFFERFAELPEGASAPEGFRTLGREAGMHVVGPRLAESDPL